MNEPCPCGSGLAESACCAPIIAGAPAPTALALMRSRYTAYVRGAVNHIVATHDAKNRHEVDRDAAAKWSRETVWEGLTIRSTKAGGESDDEGEVEFVARGKTNGKPFEHGERSHFRRVDGRWYYVKGRGGGEPVRAVEKAGRNDPCPCGSGKKFKRCHGGWRGSYSADMRLPGLCLASMILLACGDDEETPSTADAAPVTDAPADPDAPPVACEVGARAEGDIGPAGGEVALCGAFVAVAAGELSTTIHFTIEMVASPPAPSAPLALGGPAFRFTSDNREATAMAEVHVPHGGHTGRVEMVAVVDGELIFFEACGSDETTVWQFFAGGGVGPLGTFVAINDTHVYPDSQAGLGSGTVEAMFAARQIAYDVATDGTAFDENFGDDVNLTVEVVTPDTRDFEQLRVQLFVPAGGGDPQVIHAQWFSPPDLWSLNFANPDVTTDVVLGEAGRITGSVAGTFENGTGESLPFSVNLDVTAEYYRFPPERVCPGGPE